MLLRSAYHSLLGLVLLSLNVHFKTEAIGVGRGWIIIGSPAVSGWLSLNLGQHGLLLMSRSRLLRSLRSFLPEIG